MRPAARSRSRSARSIIRTSRRPTIQVNPTDKLSFFDGLCSLPIRAVGADPKQEAFNASLTSFQHPDHDTAEWPPKGANGS